MNKGAGYPERNYIRACQSMISLPRYFVSLLCLCTQYRKILFNINTIIYSPTAQSRVQIRHDRVQIFWLFGQLVILYC